MYFNEPLDDRTQFIPNQLFSVIFYFLILLFCYSSTIQRLVNDSFLNAMKFIIMCIQPLILKIV